MSRNIVAIDPSLTCTGICWGADAQHWQVQVCKSKPIGTNVGDRIRRYERLIQQVDAICKAAKPALIFIEGYAYSSNTGGQMYLGEFGGLLRWHLTEHTSHVYEVAATTLKKFATGKGNAKKEQVIGHVQKNWNQLFNTSDEADAFVLYQMALCAAGRVEPKNQPQREAVQKVIQQTPMTASDLRVVCNSKSPY